jgi:hypothetical protein
VGGQRQGSGVAAVDASEVEPEPVVDGCEVVREVEGESVLLGGVGTGVAEDAEGELVPLGQGEGLVGDLRGDGDEAGSPCGDLVVVLLEGAQGDVAVRAPGATVERQHDRAAREQTGQADGLTGRRRQAEEGGLSADAECAVCLTGVGEFLAGSAHDLSCLVGDLLLAGCVEGVQLGVEGHRQVPPGSSAARASHHQLGTTVSS